MIRAEIKVLLMKIALHQMCSGIDVSVNAKKIAEAIARASDNDAKFYFAPEMSGLLDRDRIRASPQIVEENQNILVNQAIASAKQAGIWVHIGSVPVRLEDNPTKFANRSLLIGPDGLIHARYDKMHLFDVDLETGETWRESSAYQAGTDAVLADTPLGKIGLTICYDLRFSELYMRLARNGATIFVIPAAFTVPTGSAHWHILLRARAIESAAFVIAAAQSGTHADGRETYGHSLVVDPWGEVLLDMGQGEGIGYADLDLSRVDAVRKQIPVHINRRDIPTDVTRF
jgi:deaminated glutathione amidase